MSATSTRTGAGRPNASSHAELEEAACELAFEVGWENVSADAIAKRTGISRSSFFNYFPIKTDVLWRSVDESLKQSDTLAEFVHLLEVAGPPTALTYRDVMRAREAAIESSSTRVQHLAEKLESAPLETVSPAGATFEPHLEDAVRLIRASAIASGAITAVMEWASAGVSRGPLGDYLTAVFGPDWQEM
ncbi:TetR/AcrR family transcriptional regulator [Gulosibacter sp. 10]|uniref:TetR/AcrR family transcriptional regulator n=1 Tax=Gulosibacter sp. 10 TaxID=1255570 RepID=UPI00097EA23B|nr:TetR/AcrR family transcriptional regulator [Gulosibacter sp. 10]SJM61955.1 Transcriptional regulator, TetR family [Gulosibacter sp. 10]